MIRRECLEGVGSYNPSYAAGAEDYDLNLLLAQRYPVVMLDQVLYRYRWHEASSSGSLTERIEKWQNLHREVRKAHFRNLPGDLAPEAWSALSRYYWDALALYRLEEAQLLFRPCLRHQRRKAKATAYYLGSFLPRPAIRLFHWARCVTARSQPSTSQRTLHRQRKHSRRRSLP